MDPKKLVVGKIYGGPKKGGRVRYLGFYTLSLYTNSGYWFQTLWGMWTYKMTRNEVLNEIYEVD